MWNCKKQGMGEFEIKNLSVQQIYDLMFYDSFVCQIAKGKKPIEVVQTLEHLQDLERRLNL